MTILSDSYCLGCGYCLNHLPFARCPECGRKFNRADARSFSTIPHFSPRLRRLLRIPAWPLALAAVGLLAAQIYLQRLPAPLSVSLWNIRWLLNMWLVVLALWFFAAVILPVLACLRRIPRDAQRRGTRWRWVPMVLLPAMAVSVSHFELGFPLAFFFSRPALSSLVAQAARDYPTLNIPPRTVGLFQATEIYANGDSVVLVIAPDMLLVHTNGPPAPFPATSVRPLPYADGRWALCTAAPGISLRALFKEAILAHLFQNPEPRAVPFLLAELKRDQHPRAFDELVIALCDDSDLEFGGIFRSSNDDPALHEIAAPQPVPLEPEARLRAELQVLSRLGARAVPGLIQALDTHASAPRLCITALGLIARDALPAVPHIARYLTDPDPFTRATAAWALGMIDSADCTEPAALLEALGDPDVTVALNALIALENAALGPQDRLPAYAHYLQQHATLQALVGPGDIRPSREPAPFTTDSPDPLPSDFLVMQFVTERLRFDSPDADSILVPLIETLRGIHGHYLAMGRTGDSSAIFISGWTPLEQRAHTSESLVLQLLAEMDPPPKAALPAVMALLEFRLRPQAPEEEFTGGTFEMLVKLAQRLDPAATNRIIALYLQALETTRQHAIFQPFGVGDPSADRNFSAWSDPRYSGPTNNLKNLEALAALLQQIDPHNMTIRNLLRDDLQRPVNDPQRIWATQIAHVFELPESVRLANVLALLAEGNTHALLAALNSARTLHPIPPSVIDTLLARLAREPALTAPPLNHEYRNDLFHEILALLLGLEPPAQPSASVVEYLTREANAYPLRFNSALRSQNLPQLAQRFPGVIERILATQKMPPPPPDDILLQRDEEYYGTAAVLSGLRAAPHQYPTYPELMNAVVHLPHTFFEPARDLMLNLISGGYSHEKHETLPPLEPLLLDMTADPTTLRVARQAALTLLIRMHWNSAVEERLQRNFLSSDPDCRAAAMSACGEFWDLDATALAFLRRMLSVPELAENIRGGIAAVILDLASRQSLPIDEVETLIAMAGPHGDRQPDVAAIANATGSSETKAALLADIFRETSDPQTVKAAVQCLAALHASSKVLAVNEPLRQILLHMAHGSADAQLRYAARQCLVEFFPE